MTGSIFTEDDQEQVDPFAEFVAEEQQAEAIIADVVEAPTSDYTEESLDSEISEAERRFNKAALYKQWVSGRLFGDNDSPEVLEVEKEFKDFARSQLKKLIGLESETPVVASDFSPEQVAALKTLADQLLKRPSLIKPKDEPKPAPKKPAPPVLAPRAAPPKPEKAPAVVPRPVKPAQQSKPTVTNRAPVKPGQKPVQPRGTVPANESVIEEGGRKYKIYHIQASINEFGPGSASIVRGMRNGSTAKLLNDIQVYKDPNGTLFKIVRKDETPKPLPENRVPFPSDGQMSEVTQRMSEKSNFSGANQLERSLFRRG